MKKIAPSASPLPAPVRVPRTPVITEACARLAVAQSEACAPSSIAQSAFRRALLVLEGLRAQLAAAQEARAAARQRYWQQVGPAAAAVVAARRALYVPLEGALLTPYFSRLEETQIVQFIVGNAGALIERFGEDEAAIMARYVPARRAAPPAEAAPGGPGAPADAAAAARERAAQAREQARAERLAQATTLAARADQQRLQTSAKTVYRQLARTHHPDLERDPAQQRIKTELMQEITAAYETGDLYALLQLMADSAHTDAADADVLIAYTQALHRQQIDLRNQLNALQNGPDGLGTSTGKKRELELRQIKRDLRAEADYVQQVARQLHETAGLREILRELAAEGLDTV
ncbi:J domain-containing protein [Hymenobacter nivis]|nr:J domain-containing protein [Hymenobacter nivis]